MYKPKMTILHYTKEIFEHHFFMSKKIYKRKGQVFEHMPSLEHFWKIDEILYLL